MRIIHFIISTSSQKTKKIIIVKKIKIKINKYNNYIILNNDDNDSNCNNYIDSHNNYNNHSNER